MVIFLLTFQKENFTSVIVNITLSHTDIKQYYIISNHTDPNCVIGKNNFYEFKLEDFTDASYELFKFKYLEKFYPDILCPLSLYNTTLILINQTNSSDFENLQFETGMFLINKRIILVLNLSQIKSVVFWHGMPHLILEQNRMHPYWKIIYFIYENLIYKEYANVNCSTVNLKLAGTNRTQVKTLLGYKTYHNLICLLFLSFIGIFLMWKLTRFKSN